MNLISSSYNPDDVFLLLEQVDVKPTDVAEKEYLIQSGQKHYSQMISAESAPSALHEQFYQQAVAEGLTRLSMDIQALASGIKLVQQQQAKPIVLVSLVRAGLPIGVMLKHALSDLDCDVKHYAASIIVGFGLDPIAYQWLRNKYAYSQLVFVDGWTGKGAVSTQLHADLSADADYDNTVRLVTLADISGHAWLTASAEDWLIPSGMLGATVSGLISRSIRQENKMHGCLVYNKLEHCDRSNDLIDQVNTTRRQLLTTQVITPSSIWQKDERQHQRMQAQKVISDLAERFNISNINRIKPSIAEATRAVMRRMPQCILLQTADDPQTALLRHLAKSAGAPIQVVGASIAPYRAVTIIAQKSDPL